ncbi:MAG: hypothetical protein IJ234_08625 [Clostridia bacterium]|nr:hypothetical protein [Clostridia bacterium]
MGQAQGEIALYYEGKDITEYVDILECVHRDVSGGESDCLNLLVDHADKWFQWFPQKNDRIQVRRSGYDTGTLYLNTLIPEDGATRIYATAMKCGAFRKAWDTFKDKTLASIFQQVAAECGMGARIWGIQSGIVYPYILRENQTAPVFLQMLANREGAVLKCLNGNYTAIGVQYAQELSAMHEVDMDSDLISGRYIDRRDERWAGVRIASMFAKGEARDGAGGNEFRTISTLEAEDNAQAARWARGLLLMHNRNSEALELNMDFNPGYTAMVRIDVKSGTDADGQWLVDEVEQDMINGRTSAKLLRCIATVQ